MVKRRRTTPIEITITITEPAGSGRVISEQMVAANRQRNPQLRGGNPACGSSQTTAASSSGAAQRQRSDDSCTHLYMRKRRPLNPAAAVCVSEGVTSRAASIAIAVVAAVTAVAGLRAQATDSATPAIVERVGRYVETYLEAFSAVVSEEHQVQRLIRPDGRVKKVRELTSDFLLV